MYSKVLGSNRRPRRPSLAAMTALLAAVIAAGPVLAHKLEWPSWNEWADQHYTTTRTHEDTVRSFLSMYWNSTRASNMRHVAGHGFRFTHDARDISSNLNATGSTWTQLPSPYYDKDDDNGDRKWEEAEVTAEASSFPTAGVWYDSYLYHMRWWASCSTCQPVNWDPDSGYIQQAEQLSEQLWWTSDKWDCTPNGDYAPCSVLISQLWYRWQQKPSSFSSSTTAAISSSEPAPSAGVGVTQDEVGFAPEIIVPAGVPFGVASIDRRDYLITPDLSQGLEAYAASARALAADVVATGSARGMATFSRPLAWSEIADLEALGATIHSVELVSDEMGDGLRWTFIGPYSASTPALMEGLAPEDNIPMLGVVAAEITVPDAAALARLTAEPSVFVIDLSPAYVRRLAADYEDILVNDLYWHLAGWLE